MLVLRLFAVILTCFLAIAEASAQSSPYRLGVQDRLRVHVHEWPVLTGEFTIGIDGSVILPLIGEVKAMGLTTFELSSAISERLKSRTHLLTAPETVVDIAQYRPFYIVGGVERPGEYAFRPGLVVLKAVSIAGGFYRAPRSLDWGIERDSITAQGELRTFSDRLEELNAREIRLRAEAVDSDEFPAPSGTITAEMKMFLGEEKRLFEARRERHLTQIAAYEKSIALAKQEIASLSSQIATVQGQFTSAKSELDQTRQRVATGASNLARILPLERAVAQIERERKELDSAILRTRQQINNYEREILDLASLRKSSALSELQTLTALVKDTEAKMATARLMIEGAINEPRARLDLTGPDEVQVRYFLVREVDGISEEHEVGETTPVLPGSIVKVLRTSPMRRGTASRSINTDGSLPRARLQN